MQNTFQIIKTVASVVFVVCGTVALWMAPQLALPLFVGSVAWSQVQA